MRALILAAAILGVLSSANATKAGLSTSPRAESATADPAGVPDQATQETEDQIRLTKAKRREVQRRLAKLGFDTKVNGKFDDLTRAAITRWQEEHDYLKTGTRHCWPRASQRPRPVKRILIRTIAGAILTTPAARADHFV